MKSLKDILSSTEDVRESDIPDQWKESFNLFMFGQTCMVEYNEDGSFKEFIYYGGDFRRWYYLNEKSILRDDKINKLLE
jgi:hypothetical protein